jgi:predicted NAD/FAD-dependent oxidoreductase
LQVQLFDKSRGVGGRLATRRAPSGVFFDHGAQYFTVRDLRFARYVCAWMDEGLVAPWEGRIVEIREGQIGEEKTGVERYVGVPAMNSIARHLAQDLPITHETRVSRLHGSPGQWRLESEDGRDLGTFDYVLLNCPPRQAVDLLPPGEPMTARVAAVQMDPCWSVLIELEQPLQLDFDAAFVHDNPLSWIARDSSKPGRPAGVTWILHASGDWSIRHLEDDPDDVLAELLSAFSDATGEMISDAITLAAHRWRYAKPSKPLAQPCVWDPTLQLGACGDWCDGPRVEGAFLSGQAMAGALLRHLTIDRKSPSAQATLFDQPPPNISRSSTAP